MRLILFSSLAFLLLFGGCQRCQIRKEETKEATASWNDVVLFAKTHLPTEGKLVQTSDGFAYVKVDDRYIHDLFPKLKAPGYGTPPYFSRKDAPGAHISVFYENERVVVSEVGKSFNFTLKDIVVVEPKKGVKYIVLMVNAPELEQLRQKYGLKPKLNNHEFHITIGKKTER
jgi:hypothetical protein